MKTRLLSTLLGGCVVAVCAFVSAPRQSEAFPPPPLTGDTIAGIVRDSGGAPVAGITVTLDAPFGPDFAVTTNNRGRFRFKNLFPGTYVVATCDGADSTTVSLACCDVFVTLTASCVD